MKFFNNPEISRSVIVHGMIVVISTTAMKIFAGDTATIIMFIVCLLYSMYYFAIEYERYKKISKSK